MDEFKYLSVLFMSEGKTEREVDRRIGAALAVMQMLKWSIVVRRELSQMAKLSIYRSLYVLTLINGHELRLVTEIMKLRLHQPK